MRPLPALFFAITGLALALQAEAAPASRFTLKRPPRIEPMAQQSAHYTLKARFNREEVAGELRENTRFSLIGRMAKAGIDCDFNTVFADGFELP